MKQVGETERMCAEGDRNGNDVLAGSTDLVDRYRTLVGNVHAALVPLDTITVSDVDELVRPALAHPDARTILGARLDSIDDVVSSLNDEIARFHPGSPSSATGVAALVRIYLLSQIDSFWWGDVEPFHEPNLSTASELRDLQALAAAGQLAFRFKPQPAGLGGRVRNAVVRRCLPRHEPHTAGLSQTMARPELISLLNGIGRDFAREAPAGTPQLWVTSLLRTVEQQHRLRELGYSAVLPSAHCTGYAADVEMRWFADFDADQALATILLDYQAHGMVNVVDEGQAWHVCMSPRAIADHRS